MKFKKLGALILGAILTVGIAAGVGLNENSDKVSASGEDIVTYSFITGSGNTWGTSNSSSLTKSDVVWKTTLTNAGNYNSNNYAGQQFGTSSKNGKLIAETASVWNYKDKSKIKEIRMWLNNGSGTISTYDVLIGGYACNKSGTISKNSSAGKDYTKASMITYTPNERDEGIIKIEVASTSNAWYWCGIEIDCYAPVESDVSLTSIDSAAGNAIATFGDIEWDLSEIIINGKLNNSDNVVDVTKYVNITTETPVPAFGGASSGLIDITVTPKVENIESKTLSVNYVVSEPEKGTHPDFPFSVEEARAKALEVGAAGTTINYYTKGYVTEIKEHNSKYSSISYYIGDTTNSADTLYVYSGKGLNEQGFSSIDDLSVGYEVVVCGILKNYDNGTLEYDKNNYLVSLKAPEPTEITGIPSDISLPLGTEYQLEPSSDHPSEFMYTSNNENILVDASSGLITFSDTVSENNVGDVATITVTATGAENLSVSTNVTIGHKQLVSLSRKGYFRFQVGQTVAQCEGENSLKANWTFGDSTNITIADSNLSFTVGGEVKNKDYQFQSTDNGLEIVFSFEDPNYDITCVAEATLEVSNKYEFTSLSYNLVSGSNYIVRGVEGNNNLSCSYVSWTGELNAEDIQITSSDPSILQGTLGDSTYSTTTKVGNFVIELSVDGESEKQVAITVTLSFDENNIISKEVIVLVRNTSPTFTGGSSINLINSTEDITTGEYVIAANVDGTYYAMNPNNWPGSKINGVEISLTEGTISQETFDNYKVTLTKSNDNVLISFLDSENSTKYIKYTSSTNIVADIAEYNWTISNGTKGTFRISSSTSGRGLVFRAGTYYQFGGYSLSNISATGTEYYDLELFKLEQTDGTYDDVTIVSNFVNDYMHHEDIAISDKTLGVCGEYFDSAYAEFKKFTDAQKLIFKNVFELSYDRLQAWASANNASFEVNEEGKLIEVNGLNAVALLNGDTSFIVVLIALTALSAFAFVYVAKREQRKNEL